MKRRDFLKGATLATVVITVPVLAQERIYSFAELFGPSPFPNPIYHSLNTPLLEGIIKPLERAGRLTKSCAGTHYGYYNSCLVEIKAQYTQKEVDAICQQSLAYLDDYGFIETGGPGHHRLWFIDYAYQSGYLMLAHHGSAKGKRWQYGNE